MYVQGTWVLNMQSFKQGASTKNVGNGKLV